MDNQLKLNSVLQGNSLDVLKTLPSNSVDSIVTDPPYELGFMGKSWDSTGIAYNVELWKECLRVLKHGGHLLAFGGTRTYHRMACAIEDAGFEIRDQIQWLYGSGFPKSHNISKAIDKKLGKEREVVGKSNSKGIRSGGGNYVGDDYKQVGYDITAPASDLAKEYDGWGTALKPANEPIVLARKPISEKTVADNVMKWSTGGINIDECRVGMSQDDIDMINKKSSKNPTTNYSDKDDKIYGKYALDKASPANELGRFPSNIILDEEAGRILDEQSGISKSKKSMRGVGYTDSNVFGRGDKNFDTERGFNDIGGASRFFYCAKATKKEKGEFNNHPTVKPIKLMEYLVRLVTPKNGTVLDPFAGSGSTLVSAKNQNFNYIGIELEEEHIEIINKRLEMN